LKSDAFAAYVDGTAHLGKFSIIGGIRYSDEKKHKVFRRTTSGPWLIDVSKRFKDVTPRLGLQYAIDGRSNVYATWSKGFKSGTFNPTVNDRIPVNPEKATAYEVGFKTSQPTFRLNTSAYYYRYSDIQVSAYDYTTGTSRLINAAKAEIYGADADLTISPTREFDLHVGAAYTHARDRKHNQHRRCQRERDDPRTCIHGERRDELPHRSRQRQCRIRRVRVLQQPRELYL
jgi:iron complex outermembrane receptor protein